MAQPLGAVRSGPVCGPSSFAHWLKRCTKTDSLKIDRRPRKGRGWGLVATQQLRPHEVLISLPWSYLISAPAEADEIDASSSMMPIARELADMLSRFSGQPDPWIETLPASVPLPWLYWNDDDIAQLQDEVILQEIACMRQSLKQKCQNELNIDMVQRALSLVYSRAHMSHGNFIIAPGIDNVNHDFSANSFVRTVHSPEACQGITALEEVAPLPESTPHANSTGSASVFELVVGDASIAAGDEVTISYGPWHNDRYLLHYGFIPESNPHDAVTLFKDHLELICYAGQQLGTSPLKYVDTCDCPDFREEVLDTVNKGDEQKIIMMQQGIDTETLARMVSVMEATFGIKEQQEELIRTLLVSRCTDILNSYPTSLEHDVEELKQLRSKPYDSPLTIALMYRISKKNILTSVIRNFN